MLLTLLLACLSVLSAAILASIFCEDSLGFSFNKKQTHVFKINPSPNIKAILNFVCNVEDLNTKTNFTYRRQALLREFLVQYLSNFLSARLYFIEFVIKSSWKRKKNLKKWLTICQKSTNCTYHKNTVYSNFWLFSCWL